MTLEEDKKLVEQFEDVALQRYLMRPRITDRNLIAKGWKIRYAVDTNVLSFYVDPEQSASRRDDERGVLIGVGEIFRSDPPSKKVEIAAALAYHIWHDLQGKPPLLLLPPLQTEFQHAIDYFLSRQAEERASVGDDHIQRICENVAKTGRKISEDDLRNIRFTVTQDGSYHARVRRLRQIFARDRLRHAQAPLGEHFDTEFQDALKSEAGDLGRSLDLATLKKDWSRRLIGLGRKQTAESRRDVEVLARIELYNRLLDPKKRRIVYITGDNSLFEAGHQYKPATASGDQTTFADCFLRHPRAFLDEPGVLSPHASIVEEGTTLTDWMDLLLGQFDDAVGIKPPSRGQIQLPEAMQRTIKNSTQGESERGTQFDINDRWEKYEAATSGDVPDAALYYMLKALGERAGDGGTASAVEVEKQIELVREELHKRKIQAWEEFFAVSRAKRLVIEVTERGVSQVRDVAPACFEARPRLIEFLKVARSWLSPSGKFSREKYVWYLDEIRREDPSGYSDYLAHANLLAHQGHWWSAAILCVRAKERARDPIDDYAGSNGREANYLEAFYRRLSARKKADLDGLEDLLRDANEIYDKEVAIAKKGTQRDWPHDPVAERFTSEDLALGLTRLHFDWAKAPRESARGAALAGMASLVPRLQEHADSLRQRINEPAPEPSSPRPDRVTPLLFRTEIRHQLELRALRNIVAIGLLNRDCRDDARVAWSRLPPSKEDAAGQSLFSSFLWHCGCALFEKKPKVRDASLRKLVLQHAADGFSAIQVFPYDKQRIPALFEAVKSEPMS
jgi:hypothetical protein